MGVRLWHCVWASFRFPHLAPNKVSPKTLKYFEGCYFLPVYMMENKGYGVDPRSHWRSLFCKKRREELRIHSFSLLQRDGWINHEYIQKSRDQHWGHNDNKLSGRPFYWFTSDLSRHLLAGHYHKKDLTFSWISIQAQNSHSTHIPIITLFVTS